GLRPVLQRGADRLDRAGGAGAAGRRVVAAGAGGPRRVVGGPGVGVPGAHPAPRRARCL
ncbi:MAG: hypothetical protein AVDCRST_MAG35-936, partial [uncultured Quadrisphaera sp.]